MNLVSVGTVAFDAVETPFGKTDKIIGGACTYISLSASYFNSNPRFLNSLFTLFNFRKYSGKNKIVDIKNKNEINNIFFIFIVKIIKNFFIYLHLHL